MCPVEATRSPQEECAAQGMVYHSCGSACPATCDNQSPSCIELCTPGEFNDAVEQGPANFNLCTSLTQAASAQMEWF